MENPVEILETRTVVIPISLLRRIERLRKDHRNPRLLKGHQFLVHLLTVGVNEVEKEVREKPLKNYREGFLKIVDGPTQSQALV